MHPWAYDLDAVDIKYIVNNNLEAEICKHLSKSVHAQIFWLSFFKPQMSCSADEFFEAIRELAEMQDMPGFYARKHKDYEHTMDELKYVVSVENNADVICKLIDEVMANSKHNCLQHQYKLYSGDFHHTTYADVNNMASTYTFESKPTMTQFSGDQHLGGLSLKEVIPFQDCDL